MYSGDAAQCLTAKKCTLSVRWTGFTGVLSDAKVPLGVKLKQKAERGVLYGISSS